MSDQLLNLPCPLPPCPNCGGNKWKFQTVPGHAYLQLSLIDAFSKLMAIAIGLAFGGLMMLYAPVLYKFGYIFLGALLVLVPLIFFVTLWLIPKISSGLEICQECGFTVKAGEIPLEK